jgi:hypothetical protein
MLKLLLLLVAAYAGFDLIRTLRTGHARTRITTVTRKHQPARYWRYVYSGIAVLVFFTLEHWSDDVSEEIATEIQTRCDIEGAAVPEHIRDFVASYAGPDRQLTLRLA